MGLELELFPWHSKEVNQEKLYDAIYSENNSALLELSPREQFMALTLEHSSDRIAGKYSAQAAAHREAMTGRLQGTIRDGQEGMQTGLALLQDAQTAQLVERRQQHEEQLAAMQGFGELVVDLGNELRSSFEAATEALGEKLDVVSSQLTGINTTLEELLKAVNNPSQVWAYEQFNIGRKAYHQGHTTEAIPYLEQAIFGHGSNTGYKLEYRFHFLLAETRLALVLSMDESALKVAESAFVDAAKFASTEDLKATALLHASRIALRYGDLPRALSYAEQGMKSTEMLPLILYQYGLIKAKQHALEQATLAIQQAAHAGGISWLLRAITDEAFKGCFDPLCNFASEFEPIIDQKMASSYYALSALLAVNGRIEQAKTVLARSVACRGSRMLFVASKDPFFAHFWPKVTEYLDTFGLRQVAPEPDTDYALAIWGAHHGVAQDALFLLDRAFLNGGSQYLRSSAKEPAFRKSGETYHHYIQEKIRNADEQLKSALSWLETQSHAWEAVDAENQKPAAFRARIEQFRSTLTAQTVEAAVLVEQEVNATFFNFRQALLERHHALAELLPKLEQEARVDRQAAISQSEKNAGRIAMVFAALLCIGLAGVAAFIYMALQGSGKYGAMIFWFLVILVGGALAVPFFSKLMEKLAGVFDRNVRNVFPELWQHHVLEQLPKLEAMQNRIQALVWPESAWHTLRAFPNYVENQPVPISLLLNGLSEQRKQQEARITKGRHEREVEGWKQEQSKHQRRRGYYLSLLFVLSIAIVAALGFGAFSYYRYAKLEAIRSKFHFLSNELKNHALIFSAPDAARLGLTYEKSGYTFSDVKTRWVSVADYGEPADFTAVLRVGKKNINISGQCQTNDGCTAVWHGLSNKDNLQLMFTEEAGRIHGLQIVLPYGRIDGTLTLNKTQEISESVTPPVSAPNSNASLSPQKESTLPEHTAEPSMRVEPSQNTEQLLKSARRDYQDKLSALRRSHTKSEAEALANEYSAAATLFSTRAEAAGETRIEGIALEQFLLTAQLKGADYVALADLREQLEAAEQDRRNCGAACRDRNHPLNAQVTGLKQAIREMKQELR